MTTELTSPGARDKQTLLDHADACERQAGALDVGPRDNGAAREMLAAAAGHLRLAATAYDADPTLVDEAHRQVDLLVELARQLPPLLRNCLSDRNLDRWPRQARWDEAQALHTRLGQLAGQVRTELPRRDHATVAGSQAISRARLAGTTGALAQAAEMIRSAIRPALLNLPHPAPETAELARLADEVAGHAAALDTWADAREEEERRENTAGNSQET